MLTFEKILETDASLPSWVDPDAKQVMFFDIETTGLSPERAFIYLIGCVYYTEHSWRTLQWFAENSSEEFLLLKNFLTLSRRYSHLLHFNGNRFDIPFVTKKLAAYSVDETPGYQRSTDLYRTLAPLKGLLGLRRLNQKSLEEAAGFHRTDPYTGKELIGKYFHWRTHKQDAELLELLLHNFEDLSGMVRLLGLLPLVRPEESIENVAARLTPDSLLITAGLNIPAASVSIATPAGRLETRGASLSLELPVENGTLRHYYPDHANYVYLPEEKTILPKAMADTIAASRKTPAAPMTCYQSVPADPRLADDPSALTVLLLHTLEAVRAM